MKTYAIGDIHGCLAQLQNLIETLRRRGMSSEDRLVFVGDYVDRGPASCQTIDYLIQLQKTQNCVFLMGNHEEMMLGYLGADPFGYETGPYWWMNGGRETIVSYSIAYPELNISYDNFEDLFPRAHVDFLNSLQLFYIQDNLLFVHAGISLAGCQAKTPELAAAASTPSEMLWDRTSRNCPNNFGTVIYGHTPSRQGVVFNHRGQGISPYSVGIDVGTVFGLNPMMALDVETWEVIQEEK